MIQEVVSVGLPVDERWKIIKTSLNRRKVPIPA